MLRRFPGVVRELRTARANSIPHSTLRRGRNPRKGWTGKDRLLAVALTEFEDSLCSCGQPRDRSFNGDMEGEYEARRDLCYACQALTQDVDAHGPVKPAEHLSVADTSRPGFVPDPRMDPSAPAGPRDPEPHRTSGPGDQQHESHVHR